MTVNDIHLEVVENVYVVDTAEANTERQESDNGETDRDNNETDNITDDLLYRIDEAPPWHITLAFALQQFVLNVGLIVTYPLMMMSVLCADSSASVTNYRTSMIGTASFVSGIATLVQTTFGVRLPVIQGAASMTYFISAIALLESKALKCPSALEISPNSSIPGIEIIYHENSTTTLYENSTGTERLVLPDENYYRDNDGVLRSSNEVWLKRLNEIQGGVICCSIFQLLLGCTGALGFLVRFIGPLTIAPTLFMLTYGGADTASRLSSAHWGIALSMVAVFFICALCMNKVQVPIVSCSCKLQRRKLKCTSSTRKMPMFSLFPALFSIGIGWLICYIVTVAGGFSDNPDDPSYKARTDTRQDATSNSPWFRFPYPFQFGLPTFTLSTIIGMLVAVLPGILESIGDYTATAFVCGEPPPPQHALNRGIAFEAIGILTAGLLGTGNAVTSWSRNAVFIGITRVASRQICQCLGVMMVAIGMFSKFLSIFASLPDVVLGGIMCATSGMISAIGVSTLRHADMTKVRNLFVFGFSILIGFVASSYARQQQDGIDVGVDQLGSLLSVLLRNAMFVSGITGFILDNIAPGTREVRGLVGFYKTHTGTEGKPSSAYNLPCPVNCAWTRWIPVCPSFAPGCSKKKITNSA